MRLRHALAVALLAAPLVANGQAAQDIDLVAPDGQTVSIDRDDYGVPHITAPTAPSLFFGQGFAAAQDRLFQMEQFWRVATGRLAEIAGPGVLDQDKQIRTVYYTPAERAAQFDALSARIRTMADAYIAGVNAYIDSTQANPAVYLPFQYTQFPFSSFAEPVERWDRDKMVAVLQFFMRRFGEIGGDELERLTELETNGPEWFELNRPINDPTAPTTISNAPPPNAPAAARRAAADAYPDGVAAFAAAGAAHVARQRQALDDLLVERGVPLKLGSFAAVLSADVAAAGHVTLLGAPQMGRPRADEKAVTSEVELVLDGGLHVAGMTVPGIPGVIIGRTAGRTWTLTTGATDNTDTYIEVLGPPTAQGVPTTRFREAFIPAIAIQEEFRVLGQAAPATDVHFRTVHGPVYFQDPGGQFVASWKYTFWERELEMVEAFYDVWEAESVGAFEAAMERVTMSFNAFYADVEQNIAFWHVGKYPVRQGNVDPRLPSMGDGSEEWVNEVDFFMQPQEINPAKGYFVNWNNKPAPWWNHGDATAWTEAAGRTYDGVTFLDAHLRQAAQDGGISFDELQELTRVVRSNAKYPEYPGSYQQVVALAPGGWGRAENVVPPGQSGFVSVAGVPSPHFADQWPLYTSSEGEGDVLMKPFPFAGLAVAAEDDPAALDVALGLPAPNPTSGGLSLPLRLETPAEVHLAVYDALGREVTVLAEGVQPAGERTIQVDASVLAPGVYVIRLVADGRAVARRFAVAR